jgi:DNA-binding CsgD family transcriptional regulator/pimeloyl-ACP methyl ester carboxylesterase
MDAPPVQYVRTSDGYDIAYAVSGEGRPFVLLPGAFEHVQLAWRYPGLQPWLEGLAARFQLIQIDERGAGMSTRGLKEDHAADHYERDIQAVIERLNPAPFVLFAATIRARGAIQFALHHPESVFAFILGPCIISQSTLVHSSGFFNVLPGDSWDLFLRSLASLYQGPGDIAKSVALLKQAYNQEDFKLRMREALETIPEEALSGLRPPTLVLHPRDYAITELSESMQVARLARATITVIDGSFALGNAEQGIRAIEAFLAEVGEARRGVTGQDRRDAGSLSPRELEVLRLLATGCSNAQIADELVISLNTVRRHVSNIFDKTGAANRAQAAIYARDHGLA